MANHEMEPWELPAAPGENRTKEGHESKIAALKEPKKTAGKSNNIRRAERKEEEARHLLREAAYLRDLERRLATISQPGDS